MSGIIGSSNSIVTLNGSNIDAKVKVLVVSQEHAEVVLANKKDGYDTIAAKVGDKDILVLTQSKQKLLSTDQLKINGEMAEIKFVENEVNTTDEYLTKHNTAPGVVTAALVGSFVGVLVESIAKGGSLCKLAPTNCCKKNGVAYRTTPSN